MGDVGAAVGALLVAHRYFNDFEVELAGAKEQIEIPKGIEITEIGAAPLEVLVVLFPDGFGAAEGVLESLTQQPGKQGGKGAIGRSIERWHCGITARINQPAAID